MPVTYGVFIAGYLAIIGFSHRFLDEGQMSGRVQQGWLRWALLGIVALVGAGLTACYMTRALIVTFWPTAMGATYTHRRHAV